MEDWGRRGRGERESEGGKGGGGVRERGREGGSESVFLPFIHIHIHVRVETSKMHVPTQPQRRQNFHSTQLKHIYTSILVLCSTNTGF